MKELTEKQIAVLNFLIEFYNKEGRSPTTRELMTEFNIGTQRGIWVHLYALDRKGYIKTKPHTPYGIIVLFNEFTEPLVQIHRYETIHGGCE